MNASWQQWHVQCAWWLKGRLHVGMEADTHSIILLLIFWRVCLTLSLFLLLQRLVKCVHREVVDVAILQKSTPKVRCAVHRSLHVTWTSHNGISHLHNLMTPKMTCEAGAQRCPLAVGSERQPSPNSPFLVSAFPIAPSLWHYPAGRQWAPFPKAKENIFSHFRHESHYTGRHYKNTKCITDHFPKMSCHTTWFLEDHVSRISE